MSDHLPEINLTLPYITPELPGVGGKIRQKSSHFIVEEISSTLWFEDLLTM